MPNSLISRVISVQPNEIIVEAENLEQLADTAKLKVGSYLKISDHEECAIIGIISSYKLEATESNEKKYRLSVTPVGFLDTENVFHRGCHNITIPPSGAKSASSEDIANIYSQVDKKSKFTFASRCEVNSDDCVEVFVDGDKFFGGE